MHRFVNAVFSLLLLAYGAMALVACDDSSSSGAGPGFTISNN